jgi:hypothetical protein
LIENYGRIIWGYSIGMKGREAGGIIAMGEASVGSSTWIGRMGFSIDFAYWYDDDDEESSPWKTQSRLSRGHGKSSLTLSGNAQSLAATARIAFMNSDARDARHVRDVQRMI